MPNEIYHRSNWGNANAEGFGDVYFDAAATNKLYNHSDYYENSDGTDKILRDIPNKASITLTPTAYNDGSINTVIPPYQVLPQELVTNGTFDTDSDWVKETGWTISNGEASITSSGNVRLYQTGYSLDANKKYKLTVNVKSISSGSIRFRFGGTGSASNLEQITTTGVHTFISKPLITTSVVGFFVSAGTTVSIDNVSVKEIQEADFDFSRASVATRVNEKGLIEDVASGIPRIDYTTGFGSLLLEPQRTNLFQRSEEFDNSYWLKDGVSISTGIISPTGGNNAQNMVEQTSTGRHRVGVYVSVSSGTTYSLSVWAKSSNRNLVINANSSFNARSGFNLSTGSIENTTSGSATITEYPNDWFLCTVTGTATSTWAVVIYIQMQQGTTDVSYTGDGSSTLSLFGAQLEAGSYPTSYIVSNSGSATTRSADVANNSGNADLFNDSEGVLYAEIAALADDGTTRRLSISDGTNNNRVLIGYSSSSRFQFVVSDGGSVVVNKLVTVSDIALQNKVAFKYKLNDCAIWINGYEVDTDTVATMPSGLDTLNFDQANGTEDFYGKAKELAVFKEALTDAELESLTSWISFTEMATDLEYTVE